MADRSIARVFSDILENAQEIIRTEVLLAKTEALDDLRKARHRIALVASGVLAGIFAVLFTLLSAFFGLIKVLPAWSSALIVAAAMAAAAAILVNAGWKVAVPPPAKQIPDDSLKEYIA